MPLEAMELFAQLCPAAWQMARQAHLPKAKGLRASDGAREVSGLRPLTLFSSWYRLWASARLRTTDAQAWQDTWWPAEALGGKKGKELFEALAPLFQEATKHRYLISLDFSLAFDYCDPLVASFVLEKFGLPAPLGRMLLQQWTSQQRLISFNGTCMPGMEIVTRSLPQGDPFSLLAMLAVLTPAIWEIRRLHPRVVRG